ncbi:MAG: DUF177 domain-containing protein [Bacteroidales bacterium]|jgi:uncharacterized metal-binding protein YceD (DUF177 family)|nr:DUF177 domain-containing protein [Bacteroidales bacterium]
MKNELKIPFVGLKVGLHEYSLDINREFFELFEESEIESGDVKTRILLDKKTEMIVLSVFLEGSVDIECDRCLDIYSQSISYEGRIYIKFGAETVEENEELWVLSNKESHIDLSKYIYESICLSLPAQRIHPDDEDGESTCNAEMMEKYRELMSFGNDDIDDEFFSDLGIDLEEEDNEEDDSTEIDPRWEALKKLK